jgi:hypothetical protein
LPISIFLQHKLVPEINSWPTSWTLHTSTKEPWQSGTPCKLHYINHLTGRTGHIQMCSTKPFPSDTLVKSHSWAHHLSIIYLRLLPPI